LTLAEREEILAGLSAKKSIRSIARSLKRSPSTISREIQRNRGRRYYKAVDANNRARRMVRRPKPCLLEQNPPLKCIALEKLELKWFPEQISGWLKTTMPGQKLLQISAETIYKTLYYRSRSIVHHTLVKHLRMSHSLRNGKYHGRKGARGTLHIVNGISLRRRPQHADHRSSVSHWEGDLMLSSNNTHIATLID
jgi:IS30 family transposase